MAAQRGEIRPPSVALRRLGGCSEARTLAHRENSPGVQAFQARRGRPPVRPLRRPGISPAQRPRRATSNWTVIPRLSSASASRRSGRRRTQPAEPRSHPQESTMGTHHEKPPIPGPQPPSRQRDKPAFVPACAASQPQDEQQRRSKTRNERGGGSDRVFSNLTGGHSCSADAGAGTRGPAAAPTRCPGMCRQRR